eukprot:5306736-Prymnesium_polylepis.1
MCALRTAPADCWGFDRRRQVPARAAAGRVAPNHGGRVCARADGRGLGAAPAARLLPRARHVLRQRQAHQGAAAPLPGRLDRLVCVHRRRGGAVLLQLQHGRAAVLLPAAHGLDARRPRVLAHAPVVDHVAHRRRPPRRAHHLLRRQGLHRRAALARRRQPGDPRGLLLSAPLAAALVAPRAAVGAAHDGAVPRHRVTAAPRARTA